MAAFAGINSTADNGIVKSVSATKVKAQVMGSPNEQISGITFYIDYTNGTEDTYVLTATVINPTIHATNEYSLDSSSSTTPAALTKTFSATGKWVWPIAIPADASLYVVLTGSYSGSAPDSTTIVLVEARRDTIHGS
jgi:hypothetical protein